MVTRFDPTTDLDNDGVDDITGQPIDTSGETSDNRPAGSDETPQPSPDTTPEPEPEEPEPTTEELELVRREESGKRDRERREILARALRGEEEAVALVSGGEVLERFREEREAEFQEQITEQLGGVEARERLETEEFVAGPFTGFTPEEAGFTEIQDIVRERIVEQETLEGIRREEFIRETGQLPVPVTQFGIEEQLTGVEQARQDQLLTFEIGATGQRGVTTERDIQDFLISRAEADIAREQATPTRKFATTEAQRVKAETEEFILGPIPQRASTVLPRGLTGGMIDIVFIPTELTAATFDIGREIVSGRSTPKEVFDIAKGEVSPVIEETKGIIPGFFETVKTKPLVGIEESIRFTSLFVLGEGVLGAVRTPKTKTTGQTIFFPEDIPITKTKGPRTISRATEFLKKDPEVKLFIETAERVGERAVELRTFLELQTLKAIERPRIVEFVKKEVRLAKAQADVLLPTELETAFRVSVGEKTFDVPKSITPKIDKLPTDSFFRFLEKERGLAIEQGRFLVKEATPKIREFETQFEIGLGSRKVTVPKEIDIFPDLPTFETLPTDPFFRLFEKERALAISQGRFLLSEAKPKIREFETQFEIGFGGKKVTVPKELSFLPELDRLPTDPLFQLLEKERALAISQGQFLLEQIPRFPKLKVREFETQFEIGLGRRRVTVPKEIDIFPKLDKLPTDPLFEFFEKERGLAISQGQFLLEGLPTGKIKSQVLETKVKFSLEDAPGLQLEVPAVKRIKKPSVPSFPFAGKKIPVPDLVRFKIKKRPGSLISEEAIEGMGTAFELALERTKELESFLPKPDQPPPIGPKVKRREGQGIVLGGPSGNLVLLQETPTVITPPGAIPSLLGEIPTLTPTRKTPTSFLGLGFFNEGQKDQPPIFDTSPNLGLETFIPFEDTIPQFEPKDKIEFGELPTFKPVEDIGFDLSEDVVPIDEVVPFQDIIPSDDIIQEQQQFEEIIPIVRPKFKRTPTSPKPPKPVPFFLFGDRKGRKEKKLPTGFQVFFKTRDAEVRSTELPFETKVGAKKFAATVSARTGFTGFRIQEVLAPAKTVLKKKSLKGPEEFGDFFQQVGKDEFTEQPKSKRRRAVFGVSRDKKKKGTKRLGGFL